MRAPPPLGQLLAKGGGGVILLLPSAHWEAQAMRTLRAGGGVSGDGRAVNLVTVLSLLRRTLPSPSSQPWIQKARQISVQGLHIQVSSWTFCFLGWLSCDLGSPPI